MKSLKTILPFLSALALCACGGNTPGSAAETGEKMHICKIVS